MDRKESAKTNRRPLRRKLIRVAVAVAAVVFALLLTGCPQEMLIERVIENALGASVEVEWGGFLGDLRIDALRVYGRPGDMENDSPFLTASGIRVDYRLGGKGGISVPSVVIDELAVYADGSDPDDENFAFIVALLEAEPGEEDPAYLPKSVSIGSLSVHADFPDAAVSVRDLHVLVEIESSESMTITLEGDSLSGSWWVDSPEFEHPVQEAEVDATIALAGERLESTFAARVPELLEIEGSASLRLGEETTYFELALESLFMYGAGMSEIAQQFGAVQVAFDEVRLTECVVAGDLASGEWPEARAKIEVAGLSLGDHGNELYEGDIRVSFSFEGGAEGHGELNLAFAEGSELNADFTAKEDGGHVTAAFEQWTKEEFLKVLPVALRASVGELAFSTVSGRYEANWSGQDFDVDMRLESSAAEGSSSVPLLIALDARGTTGDNLSLEGELETRLGDEIVQATAYYRAEGGYSVDVLIGDVGLGPWVSLLAGQRLPEDASATLGGTVHAESASGGGPIDITPELVLSSVKYGEIELDKIDITGRMRVAEDLKSITIERLSAEADDFVTRVVLEGWDYDLEERQGGGRFEGAFDFALVAAATGLADLYGDMSFEGRVRLDGDETSTSITFVSEYIGYGDLAVPYGSELRGGATVVYALEDLHGELRDFAVTIGAGTKFTVGDTSFAVSPFHAQGDFVFESDLQVLVDLDWFQSAEGKALERSAFEITEDGLSVDWHVSFEAARLVLPEDAALVSGLSFSAEGTYDGELDGTGKVYVSELSVAGGTVHALEGDVMLRGTRLIVPSASGRLFEGWMESRLEVGLLEENAPVTLKVEMTGIDLAVLTDEVKPPKVRLTGFCDGLFEVEYSLEGLQGMYLKVSSVENLSVNRGFVEELLQSDTFLSGAGARVAEKAMSKLLGDAPQRPFDSGTLYVYLTNETIQGLVELKSEKTEAYNGLNLTVNLDMDQSALAQALRMLEESAIAEMENLSQSRAQ